MKKVGVVTIFRESNNFGAVLQAYALQQVLLGLGCEAEVIDIIFQEPQKYSSFIRYTRRIAGKIFPTDTKRGAWLRYLKSHGWRTFLPQSKEYIEEFYSLELRRRGFTRFRQNKIGTSSQYM